MKTVYTTQEGVKMNAELSFGDISEILDEFSFFLETTEGMFLIDIQYYYRITDDHFIQVAESVDGIKPELNAQYKIRYKALKKNLQFAIENMFEAHLLYQGYPEFNRSTIFTKKEFETDIVGVMRKQKDAIKRQTEATITPLITYLQEQGLYPQPSGTNVGSWIATCPSRRGHFIQVVAPSGEWGCGFYCKNGKLPEFKKRIQEIYIKKEKKEL